MGSPKYTLNSGEILFNGKNINDETPDKRSKDGIFLSFQSPLEVPGLSLSSFIRNALEKEPFRLKKTRTAMDFCSGTHRIKT